MLAQGTSTVTLRQPHWTASRHLRVALVRLIAMVTRADNRDDRRCAKDAAPRGPVLLGFMMVRANPYTVTLTQFGTTARKGDRWQESRIFHRDSLIEGTRRCVTARCQVFGSSLSCNNPRLREAVADRPCRRREGFDRPQV